MKFKKYLNDDYNDYKLLKNKKFIIRKAKFNFDDLI